MNFVSQHLWIDRHFTSLFHSNALHCYEDFLQVPDEQTIRLEDEKSITYFEFKSQEQQVGFYLKREFPKWLKLFKKFLNYKSENKLASLHELHLLQFYAENNILVVTPVAWGEKRVFGIPVAGFLVQKEVRGKDFTTLVKNGSPRERIKLLKAYGKLIGELHTKGIFSSTVRVTDLVCTSDINTEWNKMSLVIIDREKGKLEVEKYTFNKCIYYLSFILLRFRFFVGTPSAKEVCYFLKTYLEYLDIQERPLFKEIYSVIDCQQSLP